MQMLSNARCLGILSCMESLLDFVEIVLNFTVRVASQQRDWSIYGVHTMYPFKYQRSDEFKVFCSSKLPREKQADEVEKEIHGASCATQVKSQLLKREMFAFNESGRSRLWGHHVNGFLIKCGAARTA
jgi:hypothetical protein